MYTVCGGSGSSVCRRHGLRRSEPRWQKVEGVLVAGEVPGHLESIAKVPPSKVPNPQMLRLGPSNELVTLTGATN